MNREGKIIIAAQLAGMAVGDLTSLLNAIRAVPDEDRKYYYTMESYTLGQSPWIISNCNEIAFWNRGTSNAVINQVLVLLPLDFVSLPGHINEIDTTQYSYNFTGTGQNLVIAVRKQYV
jgi:hypothetical protein